MCFTENIKRILSGAVAILLILVIGYLPIHFLGWTTSTDPKFVYGTGIVVGVAGGVIWDITKRVLKLTF